MNYIGKDIYSMIGWGGVGVDCLENSFKWVMKVIFFYIFDFFIFM